MLGGVPLVHHWSDGSTRPALRRTSRERGARVTETPLDGATGGRNPPTRVVPVPGTAPLALGDPRGATEHGQRLHPRAALVCVPGAGATAKAETDASSMVDMTHTRAQQKPVR